MDPKTQPTNRQHYETINDLLYVVIRIKGRGVAAGDSAIGSDEMATGAASTLDRC